MTISIDRQSKTWAVFADGILPVKPFVPYINEAEALRDANAWVAEHTKDNPVTAEVVYPYISCIRYYYGRRRKK